MKNSFKSRGWLSYFFVPIILVNFSQPGRPCESIGGQLGTCISILSCPPVLHMIHSKAQGELRKLQLLTCGFRGSTPKVCCPIDQVENEETTTPGASISIISNSSNKANEKGLSLKDHPNFPNLPSFDSCSLTVSSDRIIGGRDVPLGTYPWMARIVYTTETGETDGCGGTVISERYVLTAAHCLFDNEDIRVHHVRLAEHNITSDPDCETPSQCSSAKDILVEKFFPHPDYNPEDKHNDIALIRLAEPIDFKKELYIQPICLPFIKEYGLDKFMVKSDQYAISAGWGKTRWNVAKGSEVLQEIKLPVIQNEDCRRMYSEFSSLQIESKQLCAGGQAGFDTCDGDSGGPLMWTHKETRKMKLFQVGVVSYGPTVCGSGLLPGVYSRVTEYLGWIVDNITS